RRYDVEARLLFIIERLIETIERRTHGLHRLQHDLQPAFHRRQPSGRRARQILRTPGLENVDRPGVRRAQFIECRTLRIGRLHNLGNAVDRPVRQIRGVVTANFGRTPLRPSARLGGTARGRTRIAAGSGHAAAGIGVVAIDAVVDVVVRIRPEVVIGIRPIHVIEEVVVGVAPEHWPDPTDDDTAAPPRPARTEESAVEPGRRELRSQSHVADGAIAEDPATQARAAHRPCNAEVTTGDADKVVAGAVEPRRGDARTAARKRTRSVPHGADARPAQGTRSKSRSRAAAGNAHSADASTGTADVTTKAADTTADATAKTADMTADLTTTP